jgi:zinc transporter ZupT
MKALIYGGIAAVLGIIGLVIWFKPFLNIITGIVPIMLILGGALALYIGYDEFQSATEQKGCGFSEDSEDKIKGCEEEITKLKEEITVLKEDKS